jgi:hypothetical protein
MKAFYKTAALSAVVFSTLAIVGAVGSGAVMASDGGPNGAYCLRNTESGSWCGFATFSQCEQSAPSPEAALVSTTRTQMRTARSIAAACVPISTNCRFGTELGQVPAVPGGRGWRLKEVGEAVLLPILTPLVRTTD